METTTTRDEETTMMMTTEINCECGQAGADAPCGWSGLREDTALVEWMPEHLRASHEAAGNSGTYPRNGAVRLRCSSDCADRIVEAEGDWARIVE